MFLYVLPGVCMYVVLLLLLWILLLLLLLSLLFFLGGAGGVGFRKIMKAFNGNTTREVEKEKRKKIQAKMDRHALRYHVAGRYCLTSLFSQFIFNTPMLGRLYFTHGTAAHCKPYSVSPCAASVL